MTRHWMEYAMRMCVPPQKTKPNPPPTMKIKKIIGEHGAMPALCKGGACPAAILADNDSVFIQGHILAADEQAVLTAPDGESFVRMSRETFGKIARQVLEA